jgi:hypothetical protein
MKPPVSICKNKNQCLVRGGNLRKSKQLCDVLTQGHLISMFCYIYHALYFTAIKGLKNGLLITPKLCDLKFS